MSDADTTPPPPEGWIGVELKQLSPPTPPTPPPPGPVDKAAKTLAGGYVLVAFILTTITGLQGGLERLLINHAWLTVLGLALAGLGIALAFVDAYLIPGTPPGGNQQEHTPAPTLTSRNKAKWWHRFWRWVKRKWRSRPAVVVFAALLFVSGIGLLVVLSTGSLSENSRPTIVTTASLAAGGSKLEGHVTASGVKSNQWIYLTVDGFQISPSKGPSGSTGTSKESVTTSSDGELPHIYLTRAGPDRNGKVDISFNIPVPFERYNNVRVGATFADDRGDEKIDPCFIGKGTKTNQSCATLFPQSSSKRPRLATTWEKSSSVNVLNVTVKATLTDPDDVVLLDLANAGNPKKGAPKGQRFYRSLLSASPTGEVESTDKVPVKNGVTTVCVVATTLSAADKNKALARQPSTRTCTPISLNLSKSSFVLLTVP